jgi:nucleotide-binding universal stress UspA family protein
MDPRSWKRILVPTDFSDPSTDALATAIAFAKLSEATLDLVHVAVEANYVLPPPVDVAPVAIDMSNIMARISESLAAEEARVREAGIACETAVLVGRPEAEIVARATEKHAQLIVMGTHGRSGLAHALLGSIAERVVQHAPCPVLIVPRKSATAG